MMRSGYYTPTQVDGRYVGYDHKSQVCGYVSRQTIADRGELHLICRDGVAL